MTVDKDYIASEIEGKKEALKKKAKKSGPSIDKVALLSPMITELSENEAVKYFEELYRAFLDFLKNNEVLKYDLYREIHQETINSMERRDYNDDSIFDYYFSFKGNKYSLDMYDNPAEFAFDPAFFNFSDDVIICEVYQHSRFYSVNNIKIGATFAYDKKQHKCVALININRHTYKYTKLPVIKELQDEDAFDRVLRRTTEKVEKK